MKFRNFTAITLLFAFGFLLGGCDGCSKEEPAKEDKSSIEIKVDKDGGSIKVDKDGGG